MPRAVRSGRSPPNKHNTYTISPPRTHFQPYNFKDSFPIFFLPAPMPLLFARQYVYFHQFLDRFFLPAFFSHLMLNMRSHVILEQKSIQTLERPLNRKRLREEFRAVRFFLDGLDEAVQLAADYPRPMNRSLFQLLIDHAYTLYPYPLSCQVRIFRGFHKRRFLSCPDVIGTPSARFFEGGRYRPPRRRSEANRAGPDRNRSRLHPAACAGTAFGIRRYQARGAAVAGTAGVFLAQNDLRGNPAEILALGLEVTRGHPVLVREPKHVHS